MMNECRLIYKSIATKDFLQSHYNLLRLTEQSADKNQTLEVTGLLLLSGNQFLQIIEGHQHHVNNIYQQIINDSRHSEVILIDYCRAEERYFDEWSMRLINMNDIYMEYKSYFMKKYTISNGAVLIPDKLFEVYSLLIDAKTYTPIQPWMGKTYTQQISKDKAD